MAIKHNQQLPNNHFRKDWQRRVRVHFDQPGRKLRRRNARLTKIAAVAPRPIDKLRPVVRCPTIKYNRRVRAGRGFSLAELKEAGISRKLAPTIGISVDGRRQNLSVESLKVNVQRLKEYQSRLILFPRRAGQAKKGDATNEEVSAAKNTVTSIKSILPITTVNKEIREIKKADMPKAIEGGAYKTLRSLRAEKRNIGGIEKRKSEAAAADEAAKK